MPKISQVTKRLRAMTVVAGLEKRLTGAKQHIDGKAYSRKELIAVFQSHLDALDRLRAAHGELAAATAHERAVAKRVNALTMWLKPVITNTYGTSPDVLADFGWTLPKKPGPKTAAAKAAGALKVRATRKARSTMGSRQRKMIRAS